MTRKKIIRNDTSVPNSNSPKVTDFGIRTISSQNFSKIVALPKLALLYRGQEVRHVNVKLIEFDDEKFIKLTPVKLGDENVE